MASNMTIGSLQSRVVHVDNAMHTGGIFTAIPKYIVWHSTGGATALEAIEWLNRPNSDNPASYHYIIDPSGMIFRMTPIEVVAYHAGKSWWPDPVPVTGPTHFETRSLNRYSYGVAFANKDSERASLTRAQLSSGYWLGRFLMEKTKVGIAANLGHREIAPLRKSDPNPLVLQCEWWRNCLGNDYESEASLFLAYRQRHM